MSGLVSGAGAETGHSIVSGVKSVQCHSENQEMTLKTDSDNIDDTGTDHVRHVLDIQVM